MKNNNKIMILALVSILLSTMIMPVAVGAMNVSELQNVPYEHEAFFAKDWYDSNDKPNLTATVEVDKTFEKNEERNLQVAITNTGYMHELKGTYNYPDNAQELTASLREYKLEYQSTTAKSVTSVLVKKNPDEPFTIKSDTGAIGLIKSGQTGKMKYRIEIDDDAPAGTYPLILNTAYDYQKDVAVFPVNKDDPLTEYNTYYDMASDNTTQTLYITVDPYANFEIIRSNNTMKAGSTQTIHSVIKNIGKETARNAVVHLSLVDPFDAKVTDYYIGTLKPEESKEVIFKITASTDAIATDYRIDTEVKYEDKYGETKYSDTLKSIVAVTPATPITEQIMKYKPFAAILIVLLILVIITKIVIAKK